MRKFKCEEIMCSGCVGRIEKALTESGIGHKVELADKTVSLEGDEGIIQKAVGLLDDLGFSAVEL